MWLVCRSRFFVALIWASRVVRPRSGAPHPHPTPQPALTPQPLPAMHCFALCARFLALRSAPSRSLSRAPLRAARRTACRSAPAFRSASSRSASRSVPSTPASRHPTPHPLLALHHFRAAPAFRSRSSCSASQFVLLRSAPPRSRFASRSASCLACLACPLRFLVRSASGSLLGSLRRLLRLGLRSLFCSLSLPPPFSSFFSLGFLCGVSFWGRWGWGGLRGVEGWASCWASVGFLG